MQRVLVTGGCGFIGSNFIRLLLASGEYEVANFDLLTYAGNRDNLKEFQKHPNYNFIKGDIADKSKVKKALKGIDLVFNFAAESHVDRSIKDSSAFVHTNVLGVKNMVECSMNAGVKRFVQISTDEVYGSVEKGSSKETDRLEPRNPYSATKASGDLIALSYFYTFGFDVIITRSSNNYGPYQYPEKIIPLFITNILEGKKVPLYGDGKNIRDWLYVEDNCKAILFAAEKGKKGEIYNIGGSNEITNIELTKKILGLLGKDESWIKFVEDRKGHDKRYSLDSTKIKSLGWKPEKEFEKGLEETIEWYKKKQYLVEKNQSKRGKSMKGVILAGGTGSRLRPLTTVTNKHLLPVYNKPMIYYPIETLKKAGIKDIMVITGTSHAGDIFSLLGSGKNFGVNFTFRVQEEAGGIPQAIALAETFVDNDKFVSINGDNILFEDISGFVKEFEKGKELSRVLLYETTKEEAKKAGVALLKGNKVIKVIEKPKEPPTNLVVIGVYMYTNDVFKVIRGLKPSQRGELEIADVHNHYIEKGSLVANKLTKEWLDAGSFDELLRANKIVGELKK